MSNVEGMYSVYFIKKTEQAYFAKLATKAKSETTLRNSIRLLSTGSSPELAEGSSSQAAVRHSTFDTAAFDRLRPRARRGELVAGCGSIFDILRFACFKIR